jgi:hypothetical protein
MNLQAPETEGLQKGHKTQNGDSGKKKGGGDSNDFDNISVICGEHLSN